MADTDAAVLRAYELRNHRLVRVLLLDPFRSSSKMVEMPVLDTGPSDFAGMDLQALENVLRIPTARHSYRSNVRAEQGPMVSLISSPSTVYSLVLWDSDTVLRIPGFNFYFELGDALSVTGPAVLFKVQGFHAADLDKVPTVSWTSRNQTDRNRQIPLSRQATARVRCAQCWEFPRSPAKKCAGCLLTEYCSQGCQRLHWKEHKEGSHGRIGGELGSVLEVSRNFRCAHMSNVSQRGWEKSGGAAHLARTHFKQFLVMILFSCCTMDMHAHMSHMCLA